MGPSYVETCHRCFVLSGMALLLVGTLMVMTSKRDNVLLELEAASEDADLGLRSTLWETAVLWTNSEQSAEEMLPHIAQYNTFILVTKGRMQPQRRTDTQPYLSAASDVALPTATINTAATVLEGALGRRLFPLTVDAVDMAQHLGLFTGSVRPYVIWEVGSGRVLVDKQLVQSTWADKKVHHMIGSMTTHFFSAMAQTLQTTASASSTTTSASTSQWSQGQLGTLMGPALSMAVAAAFAAAPPLWFCIVCPAVLGLVAPLAINVALNQLAGYLCVHMQLPDDQCFDLLIGALGLGFVLSLASAIPIFFVCRLQQCSHRDASISVREGAGGGGWRAELSALLGRKWPGWGAAQQATH